jgi:putative endonuclease
MYYLYILRSKKTQRLYTGTTDDLRRRVRDHHLGNTPSTRGKGPWYIVYVEEVPDRSTALRRERYLKSLAGSVEKQALLKGVTEDQLVRWQNLYGWRL